ncbi:hypothetical protein PYCC9005_005582 [Savitreella phatthalungensis]
MFIVRKQVLRGRHWAAVRFNSSVNDIAAAQHTGSRKAPEPTTETGTSTQRPTDTAKTNPPGGQRVPNADQQKQPETERGAEGPMAKTHDDPNAELKSNTPFRAAPIEKSAG